MKETDQGTVIRSVYAATRASVRVAVCATVESYDAAEQTATVTPMVQLWRVDDSGARVTIPVVTLPGCPVIWPGGSLHGLTMSLAAGDTVTLLVRDASHDEADSGSPVPALPQSTRRLDLSDAVVLPGYVVPATGQPSANRHASGAPVLYMDAGEALRIGDSGAAFNLARGDLSDSELSSISTYLLGALASWAALVTTATGVAALTPFGGVSSVQTSRAKVDG